jgi:hypothetical protein
MASARPNLITLCDAIPPKPPRNVPPNSPNLQKEAQHGKHLQNGAEMNIIKIASALAVAGLLSGGGAALLTAHTTPASAASHTPAATTTVTRTAAPAKPVTPAAAQPAAPTAAAKFTTWMNGTGGTVMVTDLGVLSQAKADAAAADITGLKADASALITAGDASLAAAPPAHAATWNAAFTAMVTAGQDIHAGNLPGAEAAAATVQAEITAFNAQTS